MTNSERDNEGREERGGWRDRPKRDAIYKFVFPLFCCFGALIHIVIIVSYSLPVRVRIMG